MKTLLHCFWITVLFSGTINPIGFDDLFNGDSDPFADFDFGSMDSMFNDMSFGGDSDPFGSLFNQGDTSSFEDSSSYFNTEASAPKKEVTPPVAKSLEEAFKNAIDAKVTKLTPQYKKAIAEYLSPVITQLQLLSSHSSSLSLGIKLNTELAPHIKVVLKTLELVTKLQQNSVYHIVFLTKDFNKTREKLFNVPRDITAINEEFEKLPSDATDLNKAQSSTTQKSQKKLFTKIEALSKKTLTPLNTELLKLFEHKQAAVAIKTKQKKHAATIRGSQASASGGWSASANNYFNDGFDFNSYGGGSSWDDGGNDFWNSFGGGNDYGWDSGFGGSYGGSYDNWSSQDWGSSWGSSYGSGSSASSSPSTPQRSAHAATQSSQKSSMDSDDFSFGESKEKSSSLGGYTPPAEPAMDELEPVDQIKKLIPLVTEHIKAWDKNQNKNEIKKLLEKPAFAADIERITRIITLVAHNKETLSSDMLKKYIDFKAVLEKSIIVCVDAATYSSPPFASLFEEHAYLAHKQISQQDVRNAIAKAKRQRDYAYQKLLQLLSAIRSYESDSTLYQAILTQLQRHAYITLKQLADFCEKEKMDTNLSLEQLLQLSSLSRKLFHEPVIIGYAVISQTSQDGDETQSTKIQEVLNALRDKHETVAKHLTPILKKYYSIFNAAVILLQDAVAAVRSDLKLAEDEEFIPNHISAIQALAAKVDRMLSTPPYDTHEYNTEIRALLLPYDQQRYQHIEIQHVLITELQQLWIHASNDTKDAEEEAEEDLSSTPENNNEEVSYPAPHNTKDEAITGISTQGMSRVETEDSDDESFVEDTELDTPTDK